MRSGIVALGLFGALAVFTLTGCETGRVNKLHAGFERASDVTTVAHPHPEYATVAEGIPPVPGSPTAAGTDGRQPNNDNEARKSPGSEKGIASWPRRQPVDKFIRQ